jgi:hypothetical protein
LSSDLQKANKVDDLDCYLLMRSRDYGGNYGLPSVAPATSTASDQVIHGADWLRLVPLYIVIFFGFVGYSLMSTIFSPMILENDTAMIATNTPMARKILVGSVNQGLHRDRGRTASRNVPCG